MASRPSSVRSESVRFLEADGNAAGGNAGTWTASVEIPVGAVLIDILVTNNVAWTATTSATLTVGDATDPDGYFTAVDAKMTAAQGLSFAFPLAKQGAYITPNIATSVGIIRNQMRTAVAGAVSGRILTASIVTVGTPVTTRPGDTTVTFVYAYPDTVKSSFVSA